MTTREAAQVIGCTIQHVRTLIRAKRLKARRVRNQYAYHWCIEPGEAERYRDTPLSGRGFPRGGHRKPQPVQLRIDQVDSLVRCRIVAGDRVLWESTAEIPQGPGVARLELGPVAALRRKAAAYVRTHNLVLI